MISEGPEKMPHPPKIRCMIQHEGLHPTDYPKDINRYQIVQKEKEGSITYQPQLLVGFLFFKKWVDIGPVGCETAMEAYNWIEKVIYPQDKRPKEKIIWSGTYSSSTPDAKEYNQ
jgi:hypothetical protein